MTTYYVATLACYVLVDAENEVQARQLALPALQERYAEVLGDRDAKFEIRTVRPATADEIKWMAWYLESLSS